MKKGLLSLIFLLFLLDMFAQNFNYGIPKYENLDKYIVIDSAYIKCSYTLTYIKDTLKIQEKSVDKQVLLIGKNVSKYFSQYALEYNSFTKNELSKGKPVIPTISQKGAWSFELYKNYPTNRATITDISSMLQENYLYEEDLYVFNWKILPDKQNILSYNCQKATMSFRGRDYVAWFTTEIPVTNGPWKFGGLPGLILKLSDTKNHFVYQCDGMEQLKSKEPINFYKVDYTKVSRKDLMKTYERFHFDVVEYMKLIGVKVRVTTGATVLKLPYNPIELE